MQNLHRSVAGVEPAKHKMPKPSRAYNPISIISFGLETVTAMLKACRQLPAG